MNQVKSTKLAQRVYLKLKKTVTQFLPVNLESLGIIMLDENMRKAVIHQRPILKKFPNTIATKCINNIAGKLIRKPRSDSDIPIKGFWEKCLAFIEEHSPRKDVVVSKRSTPDSAALRRIEDQLSCVTKELANIKHIFDTYTLTPKTSLKMSEASPSVKRADSKVKAILNNNSNRFYVVITDMSVFGLRCYINSNFYRINKEERLTVEYTLNSESECVDIIDHCSVKWVKGDYCKLSRFYPSRDASGRN